MWVAGVLYPNLQGRGRYDAQDWRLQDAATSGLRTTSLQPSHSTASATLCGGAMRGGGKPCCPAQYPFVSLIDHSCCPHPLPCFE